MEFSKDVALCQLIDDQVGGIWADVEPCPGLKGVFYVPRVQDIPMMLFFQLVSFLSKGFNVLIFLLQV